MARYIPTADGRFIVDAGDKITGPTHVLTIDTANHLLQHWRREAETEDASGSRYLPAMFQGLANSLSDALTYAEELRGEGGKTRAAA